MKKKIFLKKRKKKIGYQKKKINIFKKYFKFKFKKKFKYWKKFKYRRLFKNLNTSKVTLFKAYTWHINLIQNYLLKMSQKRLIKTFPQEFWWNNKSQLRYVTYLPNFLIKTFIEYHENKVETLLLKLVPFNTKAKSSILIRRGFVAINGTIVRDAKAFVNRGDTVHIRMDKIFIERHKTLFKRYIYPYLYLKTLLFEVSSISIRSTIDWFDLKCFKYYFYKKWWDIEWLWNWTGDRYKSSRFMLTLYI